MNYNQGLRNGIERARQHLTERHQMVAALKEMCQGISNALSLQADLSDTTEQSILAARDPIVDVNVCVTLLSRGPNLESAQTICLGRLVFQGINPWPVGVLTENETLSENSQWSGMSDFETAIKLLLDDPNVAVKFLHLIS